MRALIALLRLTDDGLSDKIVGSRVPAEGEIHSSPKGDERMSQELLKLIEKARQVQIYAGRERRAADQFCLR